MKLLSELKEKPFWSAVLPVLLSAMIVIVISALGLRFMGNSNHLQSISETSRAVVDGSGVLIYQELTRVSRDLLYLAKSKTLRKFLSAEEAAGQLEQEWKMLMFARGDYQQLRLLDMQGMERLRLDWSNGMPVVVPREALQQKSERYYYQEIMALPPGAVYASAMDLNVEHGDIIEPYSPTIRLGVKLAGPGQQTRGLLIVNFSAQKLLDRLRVKFATQLSGLYLVNSQGYWLMGPDRLVEWGFMFPKRENIGFHVNGYYPDIWAEILLAPRGSLETNGQLLTYRRIDSLNSMLSDSNNLPIYGSDFPWTIIAVTDSSNSGSSVSNSRAFVVVLAGVLVLLFVTALTARRLTGRLRVAQRAGEQAKAEASRLNSVLANLQDAIVFVNSDESIAFFNPALEHLFGVDAELSANLPVTEILPQLPRQKHSNVGPIQTGSYRTELVLSMVDQRIPVDVSVYDLRTQGQSLLIIHDARDRLDAEQRMRYVVSHDLLTNLPNRYSMEEKARNLLHSALLHNRTLALLHLDLDNFKQIIHAWGQRSGDLFLKRVAQRLRLGIPDACLIGRLGGDEFVVLMPEISEQGEAVALANNIIDLMAETFRMGEVELQINVSVGVSFAPLDSDSVDLLFQHASSAREQAKWQGGNAFVIYDPLMHHQANIQLTLDNELRQACVDEQFLLHYQPKLDVRNERIVGFEALLRWDHPREGLLLPHKFMAALERNRERAADVGYWMLSEACACLAQWNHKRISRGLYPFTVALNVSSILLRDSEFVSRVRQTLDKTGCQAQWLELECSEKLLCESQDTLVSRLLSLHESDVRLVISDFGMGQRTMALLKEVPVSVLKLNKDFIASLPSAGYESAVVEAVVSMARRMSIQLVAEGVVSDVQYQAVQSLGLDILQGSWFAKPLRLAKVEELFVQPLLDAAVPADIVQLRKTTSG